MKNLFALFLLMCSLCFSNNVFSQKPITVAKTKSLQQLTIKNGDLTEFYGKPHAGMQKTYFGEMEIKKFGKRYYLLSTVQNENKVFAFELKKSFGKLKLKKHGHAICSCELKNNTKSITTDIFISGGGKYLGCKEGVKSSSISSKK